jgi:hypothetical protein
MLKLVRFPGVEPVSTSPESALKWRRALRLALQLVA